MNIGFEMEEQRNRLVIDRQNLLLLFLIGRLQRFYIVQYYHVERLHVMSVVTQFD